MSHPIEAYVNPTPFHCQSIFVHHGPWRLGLAVTHYQPSRQTLLLPACRCPWSSVSARAYSYQRWYTQAARPVQLLDGSHVLEPLHDVVVALPIRAEHGREAIVVRRPNVVAWTVDDHGGLDRKRGVSTNGKFHRAGTTVVASRMRSDEGARALGWVARVVPSFARRSRVEAAHARCT